MSLLSFIALALGMAATTADGVARPNVALIAISRASRASARRDERRVAVPAPSPFFERPVRVAGDSRPLRRLVAPLRGASAARAPGM